MIQMSMLALPSVRMTMLQPQVHAVRTLTTNSGYSVYYTALGAETPCYSRPTKSFLPATTITGSQATVITDAVFSRRYTLVKEPAPVLPKGSIAGIVINAVLLVAAPFIIVWLLRRHKRNKAEKAERAAAEQAQRESMGATFPPMEPTLTQQMSEVPASTASLATPAELGSPDTGFSTPVTLKGMPFPSGLAQNTPSSPPAYEVPGPVPFEMPGSTFIHEHHPAFGGSSTDLSREPTSPPRTPPRSPAATASTRSPVLSPSSPFRADSPGTSNIVVTPLGSPGPLTSHSPGTRFREQM
ncbi:hypothetical protein LTR70_002945 [Exophiala xenobiotica]|uniref:Transmembrane protein n=1 Tax=Lithohypha guttulata TaxID=1690604 RepID=A0ABR0K5U4_9EURO|nr:hypothetical protein LTR24_006498 [Lithohypha guttulata]KAK5324315.1 hypothetical protein LTR70_002945 [Exophiala xenobiotica]